MDGHPQVTTLERVVEEPPDRPERSPGEYETMQEITRRIALDGGWTLDLAQNIEQLFDALAPDWPTRGGEARLVVLRDALARGGVPGGGTCLEIGSGVGLHTPSLAGHFDLVVSLDFSAEMLALAPRDLSVLVRADASATPLQESSVDVVACINAFLFPEEYLRVMRPGASIVFVSTSGDQTPIYLRPEELLAALPEGFAATTSLAAWGSWTVLHRPAVSAR